MANLVKVTILSLLKPVRTLFLESAEEKCLFLTYAKVCVFYWPEYFLGFVTYQLFYCLFFRFISLFCPIYQTCYLVVRPSPAKLLLPSMCSLRGIFVYLSTKPYGKGYLEISQFFLYKRDCNFWVKLKWNHLNPLRYKRNIIRISHSHVCYGDGQQTVR